MITHYNNLPSLLTDEELNKRYQKILQRMNDGHLYDCLTTIKYKDEWSNAFHGIPEIKKTTVLKNIFANMSREHLALLVLAHEQGIDIYKLHGASEIHGDPYVVTFRYGTGSPICNLMLLSRHSDIEPVDQIKTLLSVIGSKGYDRKPTLCGFHKYKYSADKEIDFPLNKILSYEVFEQQRNIINHYEQQFAKVEVFMEHDALTIQGLKESLNYQTMHSATLTEHVEIRDNLIESKEKEIVKSRKRIQKLINEIMSDEAIKHKLQKELEKLQKLEEHEDVPSAEETLQLITVDEAVHMAGLPIDKCLDAVTG